MKQLKIIHLTLTFLLLVIVKTQSQTTNQWGNAVMGAKLSISLSNNVIDVGSAIFLHCLIKNFSTNDVCFIRTDPRGMYDVFLINASGKSIKLNGPENGGDTSDRIGKIGSSESFECVVPIPLDNKLEPGNYKITARQKIFLAKNFDRKDIIRGELASNLVEVKVK